MRGPVLVVAALLLGGCSSGGGQDDDPSGTVTVFADTSLTDVYAGLAQQLEQRYDGLDVEFDFGDSDELAERLTDGDPADVFAPAGTDPMDVVTNNGIVSRAPTLTATREGPDGVVGYPICTLSDAPNPEGALAFVQLVTSDAGQQALVDAGFDAP